MIAVHLVNVGIDWRTCSLNNFKTSKNVWEILNKKTKQKYGFKWIIKKKTLDSVSLTAFHFLSDIKENIVLWKVEMKMDYDDNDSTSTAKHLSFLGQSYCFVLWGIVGVWWKF